MGVQMHWIEKHLTVTALVTSVVAPPSLILAIYWGDWQTFSSAPVLVALLISVFLFALLRLVLLPAGHGSRPRSRWLVALITVLALLGLAGVQQLTRTTAPGNGILLLSTLVSVSLFVLVEAVARSGRLAAPPAPPVTAP